MTELKIYLDRLKNDQNVKIEETLAPDFIDVQEEDLSFTKPVQVQAEAYLADDHLIIHLSIYTTATLPCSICNKPVVFPIDLKNLCLNHPLSEIDGALFDLGEEVRETILLQAPLFLECSGGKCPERESIKIFFKKEHPSENQNKTHFPFADLE